MNARLAFVLAEIDAANAADPTADHACDRPAALVYGERMSAELTRLFPDASEPLTIAARGQHIERWKSPRSSYPEGRAGYLSWRSDLARFHAERVGTIMLEAGYDEAECEATATLLRKEEIKQNPDMQRLEDVICFVFVRHYLADFMPKHSIDDVKRILSKTARKMSPQARQRMAEEFDLPADLVPALARRAVD